MNGAIPLLPLYVSIACTGTGLPFLSILTFLLLFHCVFLSYLGQLNPEVCKMDCVVAVIVDINPYPANVDNMASSYQC